MNEEIKNDITKMENAIEQLKAAGADLFAEEIKNLQTKIENAKAEAENKIVAVEQNFVQKYGQVIAHTVEIVFLSILLYKIF